MSRPVDPVIEHVVKEFHDRFIVAGSRATEDTMSIARQYTNFILDRFDELMETAFDLLHKEQSNGA